MRTTVTLEPDVERMLRQAMAASGESFKTALNRALRRGLAGVETTPDEQPFRVSARPLVLRSGIDPARLNALNDDLAVDAFLEIAQQAPEAASAPHSSHETQRHGRSAP
jgi:hypothetical protein